MSRSDRTPPRAQPRRGARPAAKAASRVAARIALGCIAVALLLLAAAGWSRSGLVSPKPTPILEDRSGGFLSEGEPEYRNLGFWDVELPANPKLLTCLIEVEDRRFSSHLGVDPISLLRITLGNSSGGPRQGASTIAMQVARLQRPAERTAFNKLVEMSAALALVIRNGREAVLMHYLKIMPQGNQIFGAAYAARRYFRKPLSDLGLAESAILASLPKAPGRMNLFTAAGLEAARERARLILGLLRKRGKAPTWDIDEAERQLADMLPLPREERPEWAYHYILRVLEEERAIDRRSYSKPVATSLDPRIQAIVESAAERALEENARHGARNVAAVVAGRRGGEVLAYVGSASFFDSAGLGAINYARTPRSSGSTLKPFLFARGLDSGAFSPASILADLPFAVLSPSGEYRALNFDDDYLGPMLYRKALANSRNVPALRVLEGVGMGDFLDLARRMGLARGGEGPEHYGYGLAIGGLYVTLEDLVAAYGSLANEGRAFRLRWNRGGAEPDEEGRHFSSFAARTISLYLSDPAARFPSFPRMGDLEFAFPVAVKTGTSQGYRDAWTIAYTDSYIVGLWLGSPDNRPMNRVAGVVSAHYTAEILRALHPAQNRGVDIVPFPPPEDAVEASICALSGALAGPDCPSASIERFRPGEEPRAECGVHRRYVIDTATGRLADESTPVGRVALRPFTVLGAEYSLWGSRRGFSPPPAAAAPGGRPAIVIAYPIEGGRFLLDPGTSSRFQSLPLQARANPRASEIVWWVDGERFATAPYPYDARWPLERGRHLIAAALAGEDPESPETVSVSILVE